MTMAASTKSHEVPTGPRNSAKLQKQSHTWPAMAAARTAQEKPMCHLVRVKARVRTRVRARVRARFRVRVRVRRSRCATRAKLGARRAARSDGP